MKYFKQFMLEAVDFIKNTETTKQQADAAYSVLGSYIKLGLVKKVTVEIYQTNDSGAVIYKTNIKNSGDYFIIVGKRGKIINHGYSNK